MDDLNNTFEKATMMLCRASRNEDDAPGIGIAFASEIYPKTAYEHFGDPKEKFIVKITLSEVTARLALYRDMESKALFIAQLNYDVDEVNEFKQICGDGGSGFIVFGVYRNCDFFIVNPNLDKSNFHPIQVSGFQFI